jgi:hypothetical protein
MLGMSGLDLIRHLLNAAPQAIPLAGGRFEAQLFIR